MDALEAHLESLASLGTHQGHGEFTLADAQVWSRLSHTVPDGHGCLRYALRWLHRRGARSIAVSTAAPDRLALSATIEPPFLDPSQGQELDLSGTDLDLARCAVACRLGDLPDPLLSLLGSENGWSRRVGPEHGWERSEDAASHALVRLEFSLSKATWPRVARWEKDSQTRFQASPLPLCWDGRPISGAYRFPAPVLAWRHLRPQNGTSRPLAVHAPDDALESFRAARPGSADAVLGLLASAPPAGTSAFQVLIDGELVPFPEVSRRLPGLCGVLRWPESRLDLEGKLPLWNRQAREASSGLRQEAVDMALQLYHHRPMLSPIQAESGFLGLQTVLLLLLDEQRFTEGNLLAQWLRDCLGSSSRLLEDFRIGYTFDRLCALLAEPAGQPQASLRWNKAAENRARETALKQPEKAEEALLITARLELRARRPQREKLSGDTQGRLAQLAYRQQSRGRHADAAATFLLLGSAAPEGEAARFDFLEQAAVCGDQAGLPAYRERLSRERAQRGEHQDLAAGRGES